MVDIVSKQVRLTNIAKCTVFVKLLIRKEVAVRKEYTFSNPITNIYKAIAYI